MDEKDTLLVSGWLETIKSGLFLLPTVSSITLQMKPAIHHLFMDLKTQTV